MPEWLRWVTVEFVDAEAVGRLLLATALGGIIGLERERSQKAAGLRTNILICLGSALVMEVSRFVAREAGATVDPTRMAAQVVSGIGFIGAGTILVARGRVVVGLTTAATIWVVAAVGIAVGAGAYTLGVASTLLVAFVLSLLGRMEDLIFDQNGTEILELELKPDPAVVERIRALFVASGLSAHLSELEKFPDRIRAILDIRGPAANRDKILAQLTRDPEVQRVILLAVKRSK